MFEGISIKMSVAKRWLAECELKINPRSAICLIKDLIRTNKYHFEMYMDSFRVYVPINQYMTAVFIGHINDDKYFLVSDLEINEGRSIPDSKYPDTKYVITYKTTKGVKVWETTDGCAPVYYTNLHKELAILHKYEDIIGKVNVYREDEFDL